MKAHFKKRLLKLADFLDTVPRKKFDLTHWVGQSYVGKLSLSCGTTACALGWATTIPAFRKLGLRMVGRVVGMKSGYPSSPDAAKEIFDLGATGFNRLFTPTSANYPEDNVRGQLDPNATPKQVARNIRKYVEEQD